MILYPSIKREEKIGGRWVKEKEVPRHILNRRADKKLDYVLGLYCNVIGDRLTAKRSELLKKKLYLEGFHYISYLNMSYSYENRLWAFAYNLDYKTTFDASDKQAGSGQCNFIVKAAGRMGIEDARWHDNGSKCSDQEIEHYLKMLNNKLIIDRIVSLDMTNIQLTYNPGTSEWSVSFRTLIGSTTWVLIPPVMSLIKPRPEECAKVLEFLELVADAVTNVPRD